MQRKYVVEKTAEGFGHTGKEGSMQKESMTEREARAWARVHYLERKVGAAVVNGLIDMLGGPLNEAGRMEELKTATSAKPDESRTTLSTEAERDHLKKILSVIDMDQPLADYLTPEDCESCACGSGKSFDLCCKKRREECQCRTVLGLATS